MFQNLLRGVLGVGREAIPGQGSPFRGEHSPKTAALDPLGKSAEWEDWRETDMGRLVLEIHHEISAVGSRYDAWKANDSATYRSLKGDTEKQTELARFIFRHKVAVFEKTTSKSWKSSHLRGFAPFTALMRTSLDLDAEEILGWLAEIHAQNDGRRTSIKGSIPAFHDWPVASMLQAVERAAKKGPLSPASLEHLKAMLDWDVFTNQNYYHQSDVLKLRLRIEALLVGTGEVEAIPYERLSGDRFGEAIEAALVDLAPEDAAKWHRVFHFAATADAARPTKKWQAEAKGLRDDLGKEWLRQNLHDWLSLALAASVGDIRSRYQYDENSNWTETGLYTVENQTLIKGLVWIAGGFQDSKTVNMVADLCEKCMKKIRGVGPAAQATANACVWYLETTPGAEASARLTRLARSIKQKGLRNKIEKIVEKKSEATGLSANELEERAVPAYGLTLGEKTVAFGDHSLRITVEGVGKVTQTWLKADGTPQKSVPSAVKDAPALKTKLTRQRSEVTALKKVLTAQRDGIDLLFAEEIDWPLGDAEKFYVAHDLLAPIASKLIWTLSDGDAATPALYRDGTWTDVAGSPVPTGEATRARLWHPIDWPVEDVMAWRDRLAALEVVQPTKQAHREVYLLTDAERNTRTYSNRMAAHILKQHQMASLMSGRGWNYTIAGPYDDGLDKQWATRRFATSDLQAEYLIHKSAAVVEQGHGTLSCVGTDQLRFTRGGQPVELEIVPPRVFSEAMREADLFVGVASIGNDPEWLDQGETPEARDYWQSYAFGKLDGFASTRREILESVLPRLAIRDVAHIDGNFLIVDGKLNTYKIHIGSSNILMMPGDRYLCIVPGGVAKGGGHVALPFEGDARLSVILSKALMLAKDDKITDRTIVSQLVRDR